MKITKFTPENAPKATLKGVDSVTLNRTGLISVSPKACEAMGLKEGSKVALLQDEETGDIFIAADKDGFELRAGTDGKHMYFNNAGLVHKLLDMAFGSTVRIARLSRSNAINEDAGGYFLNTSQPLATKGVKK